MWRWLLILLLGIGTACQVLLPDFVYDEDDSDSGRDTADTGSTDPVDSGDTGDTASGGTDDPWEPAANGASCSRDEDCHSGHCHNRVCCESGDCCNAETTCPDGLACDMTPFVCYSECAAGGVDDDNRCATGYHCDANACFEDIVEGPCDEHSDCVSRECIGGYCCLHRGLCCAVDADCPELFDGCATDHSQTCVFSYILIPDSGQQSCWNVSNGSVDCGGLRPGFDYFGQDGHYIGDFSSDYSSYHGAEVVTETFSGLSFTASPGPVSTYADASAMCAAMEPIIGSLPWRLPTRLELLRIVNFEPGTTTGLSSLFQVSGPPYRFWSSTPLAGEVGTMWVVDVSTGLVTRSGVTQSTEQAFLCVTGG